METKLTLKLNSRSIDLAKKYVRTHSGNSLSKLVENYFNQLTKVESVREDRIPPIVASLAGVVSKVKSTVSKNEYADYLVEKYK